MGFLDMDEAGAWIMYGVGARIPLGGCHVLPEMQKQVKYKICVIFEQ